MATDNTAAITISQLDAHRERQEANRKLAAALTAAVKESFSDTVNPDQDPLALIEASKALEQLLVGISQESLRHEALVALKAHITKALEPYIIDLPLFKSTTTSLQHLINEVTAIVLNRADPCSVVSILAANITPTVEIIVKNAAGKTGAFNYTAVLGAANKLEKLVALLFGNLASLSANRAVILETQKREATRIITGILRTYANPVAFTQQGDINPLNFQHDVATILVLFRDLTARELEKSSKDQLPILQAPKLLAPAPPGDNKGEAHNMRQSMSHQARGGRRQNGVAAAAATPQRILKCVGCLQEGHGHWQCGSTWTPERANKACLALFTYRHASRKSVDEASRAHPELKLCSAFKGLAEVYNGLPLI